MSNFDGAAGNNAIAGTSSADVVLTGGGNDKIFSGGGDDLIFAGAGADFINAGTGNDVVDAGDGDDIVAAGDGNDIVVGGAGNDRIDGGTGNDVLSGGSGSDEFQFFANFGQDTITDFTFGEDKLILFKGAIGNASNIVLKTLADFQNLISTGVASVDDDGHGAAILTFPGSPGQSIKLLNLGPALGVSDPSANTNFAGTPGDDVLNTGGSNPAAMTGGAGADTLLAGLGNNNIQGGSGADNLVGGAGKDAISGGTGNDVLFGNAGNDTIDGGADNDILSGGEGNDTFQFTGAFGQDTVTDFGNGDSLTFFGFAVPGGGTKFDGVAGLQALIAQVGDYQIDGDNLTLFLSEDHSHSIKFVGYAGLAAGDPV